MVRVSIIGFVAIAVGLSCTVEGDVLFVRSPAVGTESGEQGSTVGSTMSATSMSSSDGAPPVGCTADDIAWCPPTGVSWQYQLQGEVDPSIEAALFVVDLFDVSADAIDELHAAGRGVVCHFGAGNHEGWRPDADEFPATALGNPIEGFDDERWLDPRDPTVRMLLAQRIDRAVDRGCDGLDPANVDVYRQDSGFSITAADQLDFNRWLAEQAHRRGLGVGLSGDRPHVAELLDVFDWALSVGCFAANECDALAPFVSAGKAVLSLEYVVEQSEGPGLAAMICDEADARGLSTIIKQAELEAWRLPC